MTAQPTQHLAQLNIGRLRYEVGDPRMADFVDNLARVNAIADRMTTLCRAFPLLTCALLAARAAAAAGATPVDLQGVWDRQPAVQQSQHPRVVEIGEGALRVDGVNCSIAGLRSLSGRRWYLDASCGSAETAAVVQFDLLLLDEGRLLVARRVLGTAEFYRRRSWTPIQEAG